MRRSGILALAVVAAACSDSGGGAATPAAGPVVDGPAVHVLFDAAAERAYVVQAEVAAAVLEYRGGGVTRNLLAAPTVVTLVDPSGGVRGLALPSAPAGDFTQLRLALTPGSARLQREGEPPVLLDAPADLAIPIAGRLLHDRAASWLVVGHLGGEAVVDGGVRAVWQPQLAARLDDCPVALAGLLPLGRDGVDVLAARPDAPTGALRLVFAVDCAYFDGAGRAVASRTEFLAAIDGGDELAATGSLSRSGAVLVRSARLQRRQVEPLLHGTVVASNPAAARVTLRVEDEELLGSLRPLASAYAVEVDLAGAWLHEAGRGGALAGWPCTTGCRLVLRVAARTFVQGAVVLAAEEAAIVPSEGVAPTLEWHGRVTAVDTATGTIAVAAVPFVPLVVAGEPLAGATVLVEPGTPIWRREAAGPGQFAIGLGAVQPGADVVWWRGRPLGVGGIRADLVRVRAE